MAFGGPGAEGPTPFFRVRHYRTGATIEQVRRSKMDLVMYFFSYVLGLSIARFCLQVPVPVKRPLNTSGPLKRVYSFF